tara:strand:+ start:1857 stop:2270 length:414 start_codon:yes stop_codon:yes gene_type:complete
MLTLLISGCGGTTVEVPELSPVSGIVTLDEKPLEGVLILYVPENGTPGDGSAAVSDADGKYTLKHRSGESGIQAGQYAVTFSKFVMKDGSAVESGIQPESVGARQLLPMRYTNPERTKEKATVIPEGGTFDFSLQSK